MDYGVAKFGRRQQHRAVRAPGAGRHYQPQQNVSHRTVGEQEPLHKVLERLEAMTPGQRFLLLKLLQNRARENAKTGLSPDQHSQLRALRLMQVKCA